MRKTLTAKDLIIGEKYTPINKSAGCPLSESNVWKDAQSKGQNFLYYNRKNNDGNFCFVSSYPDDSFGGDYFLPSDMIPYEESKPAPAIIANSLDIEKWAHNFPSHPSSFLFYSALLEEFGLQKHINNAPDWAVSISIAYLGSAEIRNGENSNRVQNITSIEIPRKKLTPDEEWNLLSEEEKLKLLGRK